MRITRTYRRTSSRHVRAPCLTFSRRSTHSGVVQSAERRPLEPDVGGSSPPPGASAAGGTVAGGQLRQVGVVRGEVVVLLLLLLLSHVILGRGAAAAVGRGRGRGRGRRGRAVRGGVEQAPPHVDGGGGEERPLEHVGPAEVVAAGGPVDLPDAQGQERRHHDQDDRVQLEGAAREPDLLVHHPAPKRKLSISAASSSGRSPWMLWPAPSTPSTRTPGWRRRSSPMSASSTTDHANPCTSMTGTRRPETASHQS